MFLSESTGILMNSQMNDFSFPGMSSLYKLPPSPANFMRPGKSPLSSMAPTIVTDAKGHVRLVIGAAGGSKIISGVAQVIARHLWQGLDIKQAIDMRRIHHQLLPMELELEDFDEKNVEEVRTLKPGASLNLDNKPACLTRLCYSTRPSSSSRWVTT